MWLATTTIGMWASATIRSAVGRDLRERKKHSEKVGATPQTKYFPMRTVYNGADDALDTNAV